MAEQRKYLFVGEKESLTKIGQSPIGVYHNKESHDVDEKRSIPQNTFRRKRMSVEDRLQTMMSDSTSNDNIDPEQKWIS